VALDRQNKSELINSYQTHDGDTGSPEVQIALLTKRIEQGAFPWPTTPTGKVVLSPGQMSLLLEGLEWRRVQPAWRPTAV